MKFFISLLAFLILAMPVAASEEKWQFESDEQQRLFTRLNQDLRCPRCQNQSIGGSDAPVAKDMQRKTYQLIKQGKSYDQIVDFMKVRYDDFVHYQPPVTPVTLLLWVGPFLVILVGIWLLVRRQPVQQVNPEDLAKAKELLETKE